MKCIYKNRLGIAGEAIAKNFLLEKNLKFIKGNYRFDRAEIDLIFEDERNKVLIFAEVKTRRNKNFGEPIESLTITKQNHIRKAAMGFISENAKYENHDLRIDVISIMISNGAVEIDHLENAF